MSWCDPRENYHCLWNDGTIPNNKCCGVNPNSGSYNAGLPGNGASAATNEACLTNCCQRGVCVAASNC